MRASALAAIALALALTGAAQADPAKCLIEIRRQPFVSGTCEATFEDDGGFALSGTARNGAKVEVSISVEGDGTGGGLMTVEAGNQHSFDDLGSLKRFGRCWGNAAIPILVCAARPESRSP